MEKINLKLNKIKDVIYNPITKVVFVGVATVVVVIAIIALILYQYRGKIFEYISDNYNTREIASDNIVKTEKQSESESGIITPASIAVPSDTAVGENSVVNVVKKAKPSVVSIVISKSVNTINGVSEKKQIGSGSGFIISKDGLIVTNNHVVDQVGVDYTVVMNSGKEYPAKVIAKDSVLDIALVKIMASNLLYLNFGDSDKLEVGQSVVAIGNALGQFENSVSSGIISGLSRSITAGDNFGQTEKLDKVIQTDAAINPGNSGGPLLDLNGKVIGINVARVQGSSNVGFSIPINSVKEAISSVEKTGKIVRPYAGLRYVVINSDIQAMDNLPIDYGIWVQSGMNATDYAVLPGSPAEKAGIKEGDIILSINGQKLDADHDFAIIIRSKKVGDIITMKVLSGGVERDVNITLEQIPEGL